MPQFRKDPVSGEWVIMAPERAKRPDRLKERKAKKPADLKNCPFEEPQKTGNWPPISIFEEKGKWQILIIPNKYPALTHKNDCPLEMKEGPYRLEEGVGYHELVITRDHRKDFSSLPPRHALEVFKAFKDRYRNIDQDSCMAYLSIFGNYGATAGASLDHPHYQLMALPIIPPIIMRSYAGSERYFKKHKRCIHCELLNFEKKEKVRVVGENDAAIAIAPFVSYSPYEVRIFPKKHIPSFENSPDKVLEGASGLLQKVIQSMRKKLGDPDYNFYIHTAPLQKQESFGHYHWHIEVSPRVTTEAGFEFATGIDVNVVLPETAAKLLR